MKVLYCAMRWDYGDKERGESFEHTNFYHCLVNMGFDVTYFDFKELDQMIGREAMNKKLFESAQEVNADVMFVCLFTDEILPKTIARITRETDTLTFNWFCDDHWRFDSFSRFYAPSFSFVSTTDSDSIPKYHAMGYENVIPTQWACNHFLYKPTGYPPSHNITFVGQPHGYRRKIIAYLEQHGVPVEKRGFGWNEGRLKQNEMIEWFAESRINLNLANASVKKWWSLGQRFHQQIKGRNFEVPGCGGFLITGEVAHLERCYHVGEEIVCYRDRKELLEKCRYYLEHEEERAAIARKGYERTIREHTYEIRFNEIFRRMGLS